MRRLSPRARAALLFGLVLLGAGPPWPVVRRAFAAVYAGALDGVLGPLTFGTGGHVSFLSGDRTADGRKPEGEVTSDTVLELSVARYQGTLAYGISARRDAYLPLIILAAGMAALWPLGRFRSRLVALAFGVELMVIVGAAWLFVVWSFALSVRGVYDTSPFQKRALDLAFRTLLLPPGNRFIAPLLLVAACAALSPRPATR
jgi:hypothetical protein